MYHSWKPEQQKEFLNFCTGMKGCKVMYDPFFKQVMNPDLHPERLESFLSNLLNKGVKILQVLPNESRMAAEDSLLIMDIVVEMEDGSIADIEMQKFGYKFPGQRSSCYSADLLLRQYQRVKTDMHSGETDFSYRYIKDVYTVVLFEHSPSMCKDFPNDYIHCGRVRFDTGLSIPMPQEYIYIPLDIFQGILHNRGITSDMDAWLAFLCEDEPEMVEQLIRCYPYFRELYNDLYRLCENLEDIMGYYSEALQKMDKDTVQYMIEEQLEMIKERDDLIKERDCTIEKLRSDKKKDHARIAKLEKLLAEKTGNCQ
ncbi:MAG: Rpn family recombination-promoting nuclease/putative transposase, partial [Lachnospiraceae bacterium]|nr:Rpn family recombination-promoting nuclease/putative transposase [Lachnospiraceae bacterium]